ncbi:TetR family transcriptional regulator C-terminal domain-containing protein [Crossiella sp. CA-258035]|uniref:TetR/AcrR family transcriptional regulator n=1 Tax=Crossiella sp. CA-258035 TaxID=2981138 RepID=UPI0024BD01FE|nr:TetR/AcrR family transcriptional regulator [Crossiella sp. CA-258035]WHT20165.1 TetR family transcriptional regulator C-terminal domain-containing protein [Crossiella sp. CA-258035]
MPRPSVRELIVETALSEFHRKGFSACSVEAITRAAGVPKGSFYNHFRSKEELGVEVIGRYAGNPDWYRDPKSDAPPLERLRARLVVMRDVMADNEFTKGCLIGNMGSEQADHSASIRAEVDASLASWSDVIAQTIREGQADGTARAGLDPDRTARFVLNAWQGTLLRAKAVKSEQPFDDFFAMVFDDLLAPSRG